MQAKIYRASRVPGDASPPHKWQEIESAQEAYGEEAIASLCSPNHEGRAWWDVDALN